MVKQRMIKGYTLLESVIVLLIVCMGLLWSIPLLNYDASLFAFDSLFRSELVCLQQSAYLHNESYEITLDQGIQMKHHLFVDVEGSEFKVTKLGRVSKAVTIVASSRNLVKEIKVWLGMGRVHVKG